MKSFNILLLKIGGLFSLLFLLGCGAPFWDNLVGQPLSKFPYFNHKNLFLEGDSLYFGIDPKRYPNHIGKEFDIYIVAHKSYIAWENNPILNELSGITEHVILQAGSITDNTHLIWANMTLPSEALPWLKHYDVVMDFNMNGKYDKEDDILDFLGDSEVGDLLSTGGFTLARAPDTLGTMEVNSKTYSGLDYAVNVPCKCAEAVTSSDTASKVEEVKMNSIITYPVDSDGSVSSELDTYPVVFLAHGRQAIEYGMTGLDWVAEHLASRGFICVSIDLCNKMNNGYCKLEFGQRIRHRADIIKEQIERLLNTSDDPFIVNQLRPKIDKNNIGLIGHSRGGEAVIAAENIFQELPEPGYEIKALVTLSPTDVSQNGFTGKEIHNVSCGPFRATVPHLTVFGTRDHILPFGPAFRQKDKSSSAKYAVTLYGGNHNYFNTRTPYDDVPTELPLNPEDQLQLSRYEQEALTKGMILSFLNIYLKKEDAYLPILSGHTQLHSQRRIKQIVTTSYQPAGWSNVRKSVDNFEENSHFNNNLDGLNITSSPAIQQEELLNYENNHSAHYTNGVRVKWLEQGQPYIRFNIGNKNASYYQFLNFRITQRYQPNLGIPDAPYPLNLEYERQPIFITLTDTNGNESEKIDASAYYPEIIPFPDIAQTIHHPKSIFLSVVIPLEAFTFGDSGLDLSNLAAIKFFFNEESLGDLNIDDLEFVGFDFSEP